MAKRPRRCAIGLRVKTARAIAVVLVGPATAPSVIERLELRLADPKVPDSRQPYHAALEVPEQEGKRRVARSTRAVRRVALRELRTLAEKIAADGLALRGIGLVIGSDGDPAKIGNAHVRAHASEGRLFWKVLEEAAAELDVPSLSYLEKEVYDEASFVLSRPADELKRAANELGQSVGRPWRADEKTAAIAAWAALSAR